MVPAKESNFMWVFPGIFSLPLFATFFVTLHLAFQGVAASKPDHGPALSASRTGAVEPFSAKAAQSGTGDFSCGPDRPCSNGACCGSSGWCGYGSKYCGDGCQSHCDAKAECGEFAKVPGAGCPLNVCCSQYGFCGTTSEFCGSGCQSNCDQPKPSAAPSNVQKRIIGYWEAWNSQHACGAMSIGEIPVNYLTHLNVAFAYIDSNFRITNMDGLSTDVYRDIGQVKLRSPGLKIMIALGGWAFSDPGPWQSVFPTMVSSPANRATFIKNLLGFLSEYGYDGVDFDWEYPGADDRGGSEENGINYTALLKELREAIKASGRDYLVTFTAPTSYWYLRHFDIKNMSEHVDWINLMSYDLHGVWDSSNPIGNHVLSHTNLTEIDLALDLFWRVDVDPSALVLGIGFYGRSFQLTDPSCWKPGCLFSGPGAAGKCTDTPGILSFREINEILELTGATSYLDREAAARYLVYDDNNWISYDDSHTIRSKIEYANKMGLSGIMTWALDLDDGNLDSLKAIADPELLDGIDSNYDLVDMKHLFPTEDLPPEGSKPKYGVVTFGGSGSMDPGSSAFGFLLIAGDSHVVSNLKSRADRPEPFEFIECPANTTSRPTDEVQTARVVCFSDDLAGCFSVEERGVQGTVVEMPDNCAPNQFARAISITASQDQTVPVEFAHKKQTSQVFDFKYDFNFKLMRRDSNNTSVRMDYSNLRGYWDEIVDSPGIQSRDINSRSLEERFFAPTNTDWKKLYEEEDKYTFDPSDATTIKEDITAPLFWQTAEECRIEGADYDEGFGAYVTGNIDARFYYGFSLIGKIYGETFDAKQSHGFLQVRGNQDVTFGIGGIGTIDIGKAGKGNPAVAENNKVSLKGHTINAGHTRGYVTFDPYYQVSYELVTINGSDYSSTLKAGPAPFDGHLSARVVTDYGRFQANFPLDDDVDQGDPNIYSDKREKNKIELGNDNILYSSNGDGGAIAISTYVVFGLNVDFSLLAPLFHWDLGLPQLSLTYNTMSIFATQPGGDTSCVTHDISTSAFQQSRNGASIGWDDDELIAHLVSDSQTPGEGKVCYKNAQQKRSKPNLPAAFLSNSDTNNDSDDYNNSIIDSFPISEDGFMPIKRANQKRMPGWDILPGSGIDPNQFIGINGQGVFRDATSKLPCHSCLDCEFEDKDRPPQCCGCANMDFKWEFRDIPSCPECDKRDDAETSWKKSVMLHGTGLSSRGSEDEKGSEGANNSGQLQTRAKSKAPNMMAKEVSVCQEPAEEKRYLIWPYRYPAFPANCDKQWDGVQKGKWDSISRYWGNSSDICTYWGVKGLAQADQTYVRDGTGIVKKVRANYQTEHVYEGQLIGDFFSMWLDKGHIRNQNPPPANPRPKIPCSWTNEWIKKADSNRYPWTIRRSRMYDPTASFFEVLLTELGNESHLDRLTIMLARPNEKKGTMFTGNRPTDPTMYQAMGQDEQLQSVKDIGLIFNYLNTKEVWDAFCGTYEAIYDRMGEFDDFYVNSGSGVTVPSLQKEWKEYNRIVLDSFVKRARAQFQFMFENKVCGPFGCLINPPFSRIWLVNNFVNSLQIKLTKTCKNMDVTRV